MYDYLYPVTFNQSNNKKTPLDYKSALLKAADFCAYQERSQQEVRDRLYSYGLHQDEVEEALSELIVQGFINEERFAKAYAGGKFRMKGWGKRKIIEGLKHHRISEYCLKKGLAEIDDEAYYQTLLAHASKKYHRLNEKSDYLLKGKLTQHLISKGFEYDLIKEAIEEVLLDQ